MIDKHQQLIAEKATTAYLEEIGALDGSEAKDIVRQYRKEEMEAALQSLNERVIKYDK